MHSLNHAVLGHVVAAERAGRPIRAVNPQRPERPPSVPLRARAAVRHRPPRRLDRGAAHGGTAGIPWRRYGVA